MLKKEDTWYGTEKPKWLKIFNKKKSCGFITLDRVLFGDIEGYVYDVNGKKLTIMVNNKDRLVPYGVSCHEVKKAAHLFGENFEKVKSSLVYDAWEMNYDYDRKKVEELKLRKQIGKKFKREFEVHLDRSEGISKTTIFKLDVPVIEPQTVGIMGNFIPIIRM